MNLGLGGNKIWEILPQTFSEDKSTELAGLRREREQGTQTTIEMKQIKSLSEVLTKQSLTWGFF